MNKVKQLTEWVMGAIRGENTNMIFVLLSLGMLFMVRYSFGHLAWFCELSEPVDGGGGYAGAIGIEAAYSGLNFALIYITRKNKKNKGRKLKKNEKIKSYAVETFFVWFFQIFLFYLSSVMNTYHSLSQVIGVRFVTVENLKALDAVRLFLVVQQGLIPPVMMLAFSLILQILAPAPKAVKKKAAVKQAASVPVLAEQPEPGLPEAPERPLSKKKRAALEAEKLQPQLGLTVADS